MIRELFSLKENHIQEIVLRPKGIKVILSRQIYKIKYNQDSKITRFKARQVIKGYKQREGINYDQTFASVTKGITIKVLFTLVAQYNLEIEQIDIIIAFLNRDINVEMYTEYLEGFQDRIPLGTCYKLRKSIYGLKQSLRLQQDKLRAVLYSFRYLLLTLDLYLYRNLTTGIIVCTYVDNFLIVRPNIVDINILKGQLKETFKIEDLGLYNYFLRIRVTRDRENSKLNLC